MLQCQKCTLYKQSHSGLVFTNILQGVGNKNSDIILITDSIFISDILEDKYFSDTTYREVLTNLLQQVNINFDDIYFTPLLKCYNEFKKTPNKVSVKKCVELYFNKEITEIKPKVCIFVGRFALRYFFPEIKNIKDVIGTSLYSETYKCYFIPLYDIRFLTNLQPNSPQYKDSIKGLSKIQTHKQVEYKSEEVSYSSDYEKLKELENFVTVDIETTGLDPLTDKILTFGVADRKQNLVFDISDGDIKYDLIIPELEKRKLNIQYSKFEMGFFITNNFPQLVNNVIGDPALLQFLLNPNGTISLEFLTQLYFGQVYKNMVDRKKMAETDPKIRKQYNAKDIYYTHKLFPILFNKVKEQGSLNSYKIFIFLMPIIAELETTGIKVDRKKISELIVFYTEQRDKYEKEFKRRFNLSEEFNLNSHKQLEKLLFETLELKSWRKTKAGKPSSDEVAIKQLIPKRPALKLLLDYREQKGNIEKLLLYQESIKSDGRIHAEFSKYSPESSRAMCSKPNYQNVNRESRLKEIFIAKRGYSLLYFDFSSIEFRCWCFLSKDPKGIEFINAGKDIHRYIGCRFYKKPENEITDKERDETKRVVYGSLYGATPEGVALINEVSVEFATQIQNIFFGLCRQGYLYLKELEKKISKDKFIKTPFGTYKFVPDLDMVTQKKREETMRSALNFIFQSWAAELGFISMIKIYRQIRQQNLDMKFVHQIHDADILEVKDEQLKQGIELIKNYAPNPVKLNIPLDVEIKVGKSWAELHKLKDLNIDDYLTSKKIEEANLPPEEEFVPIFTPTSPKKVYKTKKVGKDTPKIEENTEIVVEVAENKEVKEKEFLNAENRLDSFTPYYKEE